MNDIVDKAKWLVKDGMLGYDLPRAYARAVRNTKVNPHKALFVTSKLLTVPDAFAVIMPYVEQRFGMEVEFIGLGQQATGFVAYYRRCKYLMEAMAKSAYVFLEDASDVVSCVSLRPGTKVAQLWHGCGAFKKWGMSTSELAFGNTADNIRRHPFYGNLSLVTVSSPEVSWAYREAMMLEDTPDVVKPTGVSRTDVYFDEGFAAASRAWLHAKFPGIGDRKVILYAPTFRGTTRQAKAPDQLDIRLLRDRLGADWALVIKHHPFVKHAPDVPDDCADFAFQCTSADPTDALLTCADVLVTDYSSIVFEYSLFARPMVFFAYDLDEYCDWRGFYYDYEDMTPGPVVGTTRQIADCVDGLRAGFDSAEVTAFREKFMCACDGRSTERICHELGMRA